MALDLGESPALLGSLEREVARPNLENARELELGSEGRGGLESGDGENVLRVEKVLARVELGDEVLVRLGGKEGLRRVRGLGRDVVGRERVRRRREEERGRGGGEVGGGGGRG